MAAMEAVNQNARPTRATQIGLLIGSGLATVAVLGPLVSAITITVGVETQVGDASGLPDARMLPAALEGVGAVALIFLLTRRPTGGLRAWCAAFDPGQPQRRYGCARWHAVRYDERLHHLELPWHVKLLVSFVPPISGMATLHLVVEMAEDLIATVRLLVAESAETARPEVLTERIVRADPNATWRVVRERTGLSDANAKRALTAARKTLRAANGSSGP